MKNSTMCQRLGKLLDAHAGESHRPPARHQQQPGSDRPVEAGEPQIGAGERRARDRRPSFRSHRRRVRRSRSFVAERGAGQGVEGAAAGLDVIGVGNGGAERVAQARTGRPLRRGGGLADLGADFDVLACCCLMPAMTCGGMPHQTELSSAYFIILASAAENALNNPQASCAVALRSLAARIAARLLRGIVAQLHEFLDAGRCLLRAAAAARLELRRGGAAPATPRTQHQARGDQQCPAQVHELILILVPGAL